MKLTYSKINYGPSPESMYLKQLESGVFDPCDPPEKVGDANPRRVEDAIKAAGPEGVSVRALADTLGINKGTASRHAKALAEDERVAPIGAGKCLRYAAPPKDKTGPRLG